MISRYTYGNCIETEAVLEKPETGAEPMPFFAVDTKEMTLTYQMGESDRVYGLGENLRGINKRGWIYVSKCTDDPEHMEDKRSLYAAHNFLVVDGQETFGVFVDDPGILSFDIGYTKSDELKVKASDWKPGCVCDYRNGCKGYCQAVPLSDRTQLHSATLGVWIWTEPMGVRKRG